jgi:hypothetical protein
MLARREEARSQKFDQGGRVAVRILISLTRGTFPEGRGIARRRKKEVWITLPTLPTLSTLTAVHSPSGLDKFPPTEKYCFLDAFTSS